MLNTDTKDYHIAAGQRNTRMKKRGLAYLSRYMLPALLALILLIGCGPVNGANAQPGVTATHTVTAAHTPKLTPTPINLAASQCPADLQNIMTCYTPQVFSKASRARGNL